MWALGLVGPAADKGVPRMGVRTERGVECDLGDRALIALSPIPNGEVQEVIQVQVDKTNTQEWVIDDRYLRDPVKSRSGNDGRQLR